MNPELPRTPREELELRVSALLLGELSAAEAGDVRAAIATDAELSKLHDDLKQTIQLVRKAATSASETTTEPAEQLKLSEERRKKLMASFAIPPLKKSDLKPKRTVQFTLIELLVVLSIVAILAAMLLPSLAKSKSRAQAVTVLSNLRQLDGAKQQWAEENNAPPGAAPTFDDIKPYLGRGTSGQLPPVAGETYKLGKVGESPTAEAGAGKLRGRTWSLETAEPHRPVAITKIPAPQIAAPEPAATPPVSVTSDGVYDQNIVGYVQMPIPTAGNETSSRSKSAASSTPTATVGPKVNFANSSALDGHALRTIPTRPLHVSAEQERLTEIPARGSRQSAQIVLPPSAPAEVALSVSGDGSVPHDFSDRIQNSVPRAS